MALSITRSISRRCLPQKTPSRTSSLLTGPCQRSMVSGNVRSQKSPAQRPPFMVQSQRSMATAKKPATASLYDILEVDPKANQEMIKSSFYALSKKNHPDLNPDNAEANESFTQLASAYEVLSNPETRKDYDRNFFGKDRQRPGPATWSGPRSRTQRMDVDYDDIHGGPRRAGVREGWGRKVDVDLSEERMKKAWEQYRKRWKEEEDRLRALEERKRLFRTEFESKREKLYNGQMDEDERFEFKENMRHLRTPGEDFQKRVEEKENDKEKVGMAYREKDTAKYASAGDAWVQEKLAKQQEEWLKKERKEKMESKKFDPQGLPRQENPHEDEFWPKSQYKESGAEYTRRLKDETFKHIKQTLDFAAGDFKNRPSFQDGFSAHSSNSIHGDVFDQRRYTVSQYLVYASFGIVILGIAAVFLNDFLFPPSNPYLEQLLAEKKAKEDAAKKMEVAQS